jgi:electron transfer flavoprotein beta subunit
MQAKKKPCQKLSLAELGLDAAQVAPKVKVISYFLPTPRAACKLVPGEAPQAAQELCRLLRETAKII